MPPNTPRILAFCLKTLKIKLIITYNLSLMWKLYKFDRAEIHVPTTTLLAVILKDILDAG